MADKVPKTVRLPRDEITEIEQYATDRDMSEADALRRLVRVGLSTEREREPIPDGGRLTRSEHPWVDPLIYIADRAALSGVFLLLLGVFPVSVTSGAIEWYGVTLSPETAAITLSLFLHFAIMGITLSVLAAFALVALEFLMHPTEAPIRRYFPQTWPEDYREAPT